MQWFAAALPGALVAALVASIAVVAWARMVVPADPSARIALDSDEAVAVSQDEWLVFRPRDVDPVTALVFYPGGKAEPVAYAPVLHALAARGYLVVLCPMPLNLALLAPECASRIMGRYPEIRHWVVAGHSLGGVVAAEYAERHLAQVAGLVLWAAYPARFTDLASSRIAVLTVYGTADELVAPARVEAGRSRLPATAAFALLPGVDHWGFGEFDPARSAGATPRHAQQAAILEATQAFLATLAPAAPHDDPG